MLKKLLLLLLAIFLNSCGGNMKLTERKFPQKDGIPISCFEPPPDVVPKETTAKLNAAIPWLVDSLNIVASIGKTYERLRTEVPNLRAIEVLEFRLCAAFANGILNKEGYFRFLMELFPLLKAETTGSGSVLQYMKNSPGGLQVTGDLSIKNETIRPGWKLHASEKIKDDVWRTRLSVWGQGKLAYYNWNILLTFNTEVTSHQEVPGEVTRGPWMPLSSKNGKPSPNQFFIGFSEFKPTERLAFYLVSRLPLEVISVETLGE